MEDVDDVLALDLEWRQARHELDEVGGEFNKANKEVGLLMKLKRQTLKRLVIIKLYYGLQNLEDLLVKRFLMKKMKRLYLYLIKCQKDVLTLL